MQAPLQSVLFPNQCCEKEKTVAETQNSSKKQNEDKVFDKMSQREHDSHKENRKQQIKGHRNGGETALETGKESNWVQVGNAFMLLETLTHDDNPVEKVSLEQEERESNNVPLMDTEHNCKQDSYENSNNQLALAPPHQNCLKILHPDCPLNLNPRDVDNFDHHPQQTDSVKSSSKQQGTELISSEQKLNVLHRRSSSAPKTLIFKLCKSAKRGRKGGSIKTLESGSSSSISS